MTGVQTCALPICTVEAGAFRPEGPLVFEQRGEAGLSKMMIGGETILDAQLMHQGEADAVREGPLFVAMPAKKARGGVKAVRVDPLQIQRLAGGDGLQKVQRSRMAVANQQKGDGFVHDIIGGEEAAALARQFGLQADGLWMIDR